MSTFSGLGTALSSLIAQRQAIEVSGQNVSNANTVGYTRQRATIAALPAAQVPSMFSVPSGVGNGTQMTGVARLNDVFLDAKVRTTTSDQAYLAAVSGEYDQLETDLHEPKSGLSTQLTTMWSAWHDVANTPNTDSSRSVLLEKSQAVVDRIATLYSSASTQWNQARDTTVSLVEQVNTTATNVANLNDKILAITNSGGSANELMDSRDQLVTQLSQLIGAQPRARDNGTIDVYVAGNALVDGAKTRQLTVAGATTFEAATGNPFGAPPVAGQQVSVEWANRPGNPVDISGGRIAGLVAAMAPPDATGTGGLIAEAGVSYSKLANTIATQVNAIHSAAATPSGATGVNFFSFSAGLPPALGLKLAITSTSDIAAATPGLGAYDGTAADSMAQLGTVATGPDKQWSATVVAIGSKSGSADARASVAETARATAVAAQTASSSVDTDEEAVNMMASQRAYQGAARVLTTIDEMLDTLINRTGVVGR